MPEAFDLHQNRGMEFYNEGKFEEAIAEWRTAGELDSNNAWTRRGIGDALFKLGQREAALAQFREAIRLQSNYEDAHQSLVHGLIKTGQPTDALAAAHEALVLCPSSAGLYRYLGYLLGVEANQTQDKLGWEAAAAAFQRAIDLDPASSIALHSLGALNWWLGRKRKAVAGLKAAVAVDPSNLEVLNALKTGQVRTGDLRGAV